MQIEFKYDAIQSTITTCNCWLFYFKKEKKLNYFPAKYLVKTSQLVINAS